MHYGDELARVIKDMVLVSHVASWAKEIEKFGNQAFKRRGFKSGVDLATVGAYHVSNLDLMDEHSLGDVSADEAAADPDYRGKVIDEDRMDKLTGTLSQSQKIRMTELLGRWEEPASLADEKVLLSVVIVPKLFRNVSSCELTFFFLLI